MMGIEGSVYIRGLMEKTFPKYLPKRGWLYKLYKQGQKDRKNKDYSRVKFNPEKEAPPKLY